MQRVMLEDIAIGWPAMLHKVQQVYLSRELDQGYAYMGQAVLLPSC